MLQEQMSPIEPLADGARDDAPARDTVPAPGHRLGRGLRPRHVSMIAIGGIIGAGLFVGSSTAIATVGPAVVLSYALAGLLVLLVMRMLSEMAVATPGVQSFSEFARLGLGHWAGFMSGWLYWFFWDVVVAIEAIAGAKIVHGWLPQFAVWQIGMALVAVLTGVNLMSSRAYGEFEFWLSSLKVAAIIAFIAIAARYLAVDGHLGAAADNLAASGGFMPHGPLSVLGGITSVVFALCGCEIVTVAAAETADPERTVARMTSTVATRIVVFYLLSIALIVAIVPWTAVRPGLSPFATALAAMGIPGAATIMTVVVLVAVLSCLNSGLYVTSRVLFVLADRGDAPRALVALDRRRTPVRAILAGSVFSYVALAASVLSPDGVFNFLVNGSGALMLVLYLLTAVAQLRLRCRLEREAPARLRVRMWLHPWGSWLTIGGMIIVLLAMALTPSLVSQFYASALTTGAAALAFVVLRRSGRLAG